MNLRATLFDMDGLLLDSEILWHKAEVEIFGELGVPLHVDDTRSTKGMYVSEVVAHWFRTFPWDGPTPEDVVALLLQRVGDLVEHEGRLLPGARRAIAMAAQRGPLALASSTPMELIVRCLRHFDLEECFASIHSAQFEVYGKPHPAVFLRAATALDVEPAHCLVFEDSAAGVIAAKAARMRVVAVPSHEDVDEPAFVLADLVLHSLEELTESWLDENFD